MMNEKQSNLADKTERSEKLPHYEAHPSVSLEVRDEAGEADMGEIYVDGYDSDPGQSAYTSKFSQGGTHRRIRVVRRKVPHKHYSRRVDDEAKKLDEAKELDAEKHLRRRRMRTAR